jgi:DnaJ-class molecular chaperone
MNGKKVIDIKVPKGVNQGDQMRFDNVIDNGTLITEFNIMPDLRFERRGTDLYCNHSINVLDLIAGTDFGFKTINGTELKVTKHNHMLMSDCPGAACPFTIQMVMETNTYCLNPTFLIT